MILLEVPLGLAARDYFAAQGVFYTSLSPGRYLFYTLLYTLYTLFIAQRFDTLLSPRDAGLDIF